MNDVKNLPQPDITEPPEMIGDQQTGEIYN